jgi:DNA repair protein RadC
MINNKFIVYEDDKIKVQSGEDIFNKIKTININYEQENFIVFFLNNQNRILTEEILFKGGFESCLICPNTIFRKALLNNSNKIILAHNHPSNSLNPSSEDINIFQMLKSAGEIINIKVLDSIIFNKEGFFSQIETRVLK